MFQLLILFSGICVAISGPMHFNFTNSTKFPKEIDHFHDQDKCHVKTFRIDNVILQEKTFANHENFLNSFIVMEDEEKDCAGRSICNRKQNVVSVGEFIVMNIRNESYGGKSFTGAMITTMGEFNLFKNRFEFRLAMPIGDGALVCLSGIANEIIFESCYSTNDTTTVNQTVKIVPFVGSLRKKYSWTYSNSVKQQSIHRFHLMGIQINEDKIQFFFDEFYTESLNPYKKAFTGTVIESISIKIDIDLSQRKVIKATPWKFPALVFDYFRQYEFDASVNENMNEVHDENEDVTNVSNSTSFENDDDHKNDKIDDKDEGVEDVEKVTNISNITNVVNDEDDVIVENSWNVSNITIVENADEDVIVEKVWNVTNITNFENVKDVEKVTNISNITNVVSDEYDVIVENVWNVSNITNVENDDEDVIVEKVWNLSNITNVKNDGNNKNDEYAKNEKDDENVVNTVNVTNDTNIENDENDEFDNEHEDVGNVSNARVAEIKKYKKKNNSDCSRFNSTQILEDWLIKDAGKSALSGDVYNQSIKQSQIGCLLLNRFSDDIWKLIWEDTFDDTLNKSKWKVDDQFTCEENEMKSCSLPHNVEVKDGYLAMRLQAQSYDRFNYTGARITTRTSFSPQGRIEIRASFPNGGHSHVCFRTVGSTKPSAPQPGQVYIVCYSAQKVASENGFYGGIYLNGTMQQLVGHGKQNYRFKKEETDKYDPANKDYGFYIHGIEWSEQKLRYFVGNNYSRTFELNDTDFPKMLSQIQIQIGVLGSGERNEANGTWKCPVLLVDYVRVYERIPLEYLSKNQGSRCKMVVTNWSEKSMIGSICRNASETFFQYTKFDKREKPSGKNYLKWGLVAILVVLIIIYAIYTLRLIGIEIADFTLNKTGADENVCAEYNNKDGVSNQINICHFKRNQHSI